MYVYTTKTILSHLPSWLVALEKFRVPSRNFQWLKVELWTVAREHGNCDERERIQLWLCEHFERRADVFWNLCFFLIYRLIHWYGSGQSKKWFTTKASARARGDKGMIFDRSACHRSSIHQSVDIVIEQSLSFHLRLLASYDGFTSINDLWNFKMCPLVKVAKWSKNIAKSTGNQTILAFTLP